MANFDLDAKMQEQEKNQGKVNTSAVDKAKENIAAKKLEQETREVERRLANAETTEEHALKELRAARKKEEAQKVFLTDVTTARESLSPMGTVTYTTQPSERPKKNVIRRLITPNALFLVKIIGVINTH